MATGFEISFSDPSDTLTRVELRSYIHTDSTAVTNWDRLWADKTVTHSRVINL